MTKDNVEGKWVGTVIDSGKGYKAIGFSPDTLADIPVGTRCYTTTQAAQQQWVGLTDEEIEQEFGFIDELLRDCVQRIEAKLKEKNT